MSFHPLIKVSRTVWTYRGCLITHNERAKLFKVTAFLKTIPTPSDIVIESSLYGFSRLEKCVQCIDWLTDRTDHYFERIPVPDGIPGQPAQDPPKIQETESHTGGPLDSD